MADKWKIKRLNIFKKNEKIKKDQTTGLVEIKNDSGRYILSSIPKDVNINIDELNEKGDKKILIGELCPTNSISLSNASHYISNITMNDGLVIGNVLFLDTEKGHDAFTFINEGLYKFKPRIVNGKIISWDIVKNETDEELKEKISKPRGWHLRAEYIDNDGKVYHYGKLVE